MIDGGEPTLVTLGEAMLRLAVPSGERLAGSSSLAVHVAGSEANVAAAAAALGVPTRWISRLPATPLGRRVESELRAAGVETDLVEWDPDARLGLFFSDTGVPPRPSDVLYDRRDSAFMALRDLPPQALDGARIAHVSGITVALGPRPARLVGSFAEAAVGASVRLSVDVNHRARLWSEDAAREGLAPLLAVADLVVCSQRDALAVLEAGGSVDEILWHLRERWAPRASLVVLTRGADGCAALTAAGETLSEAAPPATIVDRFGMGDAFVAGLIWALLEDDDPRPALRAAVTLAALKATVMGDLSRTTASELRRALSDPETAVIR